MYIDGRKLQKYNHKQFSTLFDVKKMLLTKKSGDSFLSSYGKNEYKSNWDHRSGPNGQRDRTCNGTRGI